MKKILLSLGSLASIAAPIAAVVSCGDNITPANQSEPQVDGPAVLDTAKQTALKASANTVLGMNTSDIDSVAKAESFSLTVGGAAKDLQNAVIYNLKSTVTSFTVTAGGTTITKSTEGGGQIIVGSSSTVLRAGATKHYYIGTKTVTSGEESTSIEEVTDATVLTKIKNDIIGSAFAAPETSTTTGTSTITTPAAVNELTVQGVVGQNQAKMAALLKSVAGVDANGVEDGHNIASLTTASLKSSIDASTLEAQHKTDLKKFVDFYATDVKLAFHIMKFCTASLDPDQLFLAKMAVTTGKIEDIIKPGSTNVDDIIDGIIQKFSGEDSRFNVALVQMSYKVNKSEHKLLAQALAGTADGAMGGRETLEYILNHGSTPWTIEEAPEDPDAAAALFGF